MATERLLATARTTGRGALRNWRHRTSTKPRRRTSGRAVAPSGDRLAIAAQDGERAAGRDRLGRVRGEELDRPGERLELRLRVPEAHRDADRVDRRDVPQDREGPRGELGGRPPRAPARDPE